MDLNWYLKHGVRGPSPNENQGCKYQMKPVRVLVYVSFPFVRSDYVISAGVGFRVASGVVASP